MTDVVDNRRREQDENVDWIDLFEKARLDEISHRLGDVRGVNMVVIVVVSIV